MWQDLRYGARLLLAQPGFTLIAVLTLALGIGATTAIFSVVNAVLLRALPYPEAERLVALRPNQSFLDLNDVRSQSRSFEALGGVTLQGLDYTGGGEPVQVQAGLITADLFNVLGARPALGRLIAPEENRFGGERLAVLGHAFWQAHLGGDPGVVGKAIALSGNSYTVVGVMPADFVLPLEKADLWASLPVVSPLAAQARGVHFLRAYARLSPGVAAEAARAEMAAVDVRLAAEDPAENKGRRTRLSALHERVVGETRTALLVLFGAVGLVLLISCANFANLLLTRAAAREQEIVVRAALGAGRWRLVRQLLTESVLLALVGGTAGLVLALWGVDLLLALKPDDLPRLDEIRVDGRVLLFTLGVSVLTGLIFGLVPAWQTARTDLNAALKEGGRSTTAGASRQRMRGALVVAELALALVLLIGAGLLIKSFWGLRAVAPGFATENLQTMRVELPEARYRQIPAQVRFRQQALEAVNSLPGVRAAMVSELPLTGDYLTHNFVIEGRPLPPGDEPEIQTLTLSGDYFGVMNIPLLRGRDLTPQDREGAPYVCLVNESMVRQYFPDEDPLGKRIRWARGDSPWMTIVGVVADARHQGLDQPAEPAVYDSYAQTVQPWKRWMYLAVRGSEDPARLAAAVKRQVWTVDARLPVTRVRTMAEVASASLAGRQFVMLLLLIFAGVALLLAAVGIYGVIAYAVALRTHEIGVRMALGAGPRDVLALVLRQGLALTAAGVALGVAASLALTRIMVSLLYGVGATDPTTFGAIAVVLALVALLACYVPARRATKVDPVVALRQ